MQFKRSELKYYINDVQTEALQRQLSSLMDFDQYGNGFSGYRVRSLYFDSHDDECLYQKQSGILNRQKIRLRTYGIDGNQPVKFEIKYKSGQLVRKVSTMLGKQDAKAVIDGEYSRLLKYGNPLLDGIYATFVTKAYRPKVVVEYQRVAFTLPFSNIRITFDRNLASNINHLDLFSTVHDSMPVVLEGKQILEIKFDRFIPDYLKKVVSTVNSERMAISKYTLARRFHKIQKWEDN